MLAILVWVRRRMLALFTGRSVEGRRRASLPSALTAAVVSVAGGSVFFSCSSSSRGLTESNDAQTPGLDSGFGSASSSGSSSSGSSGSSGSPGGVSSGSTRVPSNIQFTDAGVPFCGTAACALTSNICCIGVTALGLPQARCIASNSMCLASEAQFKCLQASDCVSGSVCCGVADESAGNASAGSECQDVSLTGGHCTPVATGGASATQGSAQLCQTEAECPGGSCTWQVCNVGGLGTAANLTMCGTQSAAPFNCTPHQ